MEKEPNYKKFLEKPVIEDKDGSISIDSIKEYAKEYVETEHPGKSLLEPEAGRTFKDFAFGLQTGYLLAKQKLICPSCGNIRKYNDELPQQICMNPYCDDYIKLK